MREFCAGVAIAVALSGTFVAYVQSTLAVPSTELFLTTAVDVLLRGASRCMPARPVASRNDGFVRCRSW